MDMEEAKEEMEGDKLDIDPEVLSDTSNDESDEDADIEESPRAHKNVSSIIAEMAINNEHDAVLSSNSNALAEEEDAEKRLELSRLSPEALIAYIKELDAELYELSQREARELSRSKHLRIFGNNRRSSSK